MMQVLGFSLRTVNLCERLGGFRLRQVGQEASIEGPRKSKIG